MLFYIKDKESGKKMDSTLNGAFSHFNMGVLFIMPCLYTANPSVGTSLDFRKLPLISQNNQKINR